ncbi:MAG: hypothetical protein ACFCUT_02980 [Kiloniellaceae bacterium]
MRDKDPVSPYLQRRLRSLEEVLRQRSSAALRQPEVPLAADNSNRPIVPRRPAKSA